MVTGEEFSEGKSLTSVVADDDMHPQNPRRGCTQGIRDGVRKDVRQFILVHINNSFWRNRVLPVLFALGSERH